MIVHSLTTIDTEADGVATTVHATAHDALEALRQYFLDTDPSLKEELDTVSDGELVAWAEAQFVQVMLEHHELPDPPEIAFVQRMAGWVLDGEPVPEGHNFSDDVIDGEGNYEMSIDEAFETVHAWVEEARQIVNPPQTPTLFDEPAA